VTMFFPATAAIITSVGIVGLIVSSLVHASAAGDIVFNAAAACLIAGPLIFLFFVIIGLCLEFVDTNYKPDSRASTLGRSPDIHVAAVSQVAFQQWMPARLKRMGPLNPTGHANYRVVL
jgi:hypothetical protein